MHLRLAMSLFAIMVVAECDQRATSPMGTNQVGCPNGTNPMATNPMGINQVRTNTTGTSQMETNPKPNLLQTVKNGFAVIRDLFYFVFGNVPMFRRLLTFASDLTASLFPLSPLPPFPEPWWGDHPSSDTSITPFRVHFSDEMISDLRWRIQNRREITPSLRGAAHTYGTNSEYLEYLLDYWTQEYDFKEREGFLNSFPQYTTVIQGLRIHFIHVKSPNPRGKKVVPLLMLHGWPAVAFLNVRCIQLLLQEREDCDFVFEMVAPHNPGFGYSEATNKIGLSSYQVGIIMKNLMARLGLPRFYIQAHGLAQFIAETIAVLFPDRVLGLHTPFAMSLRPQTLVKWVMGQLYPPAVVEPKYERKMYPLTERASSLLENMGYFHVHATRPDNLGHGMDESPLAMLSWVIESLIVGTGKENMLKIHQNITDTVITDLFDMFTVFWDSQSMGTAIRLYAELTAVVQDPLLKTIMATPTPVPISVLHFKEEIVYQPDDFIRDKYPNLVYSLSLDYGGHTSPEWGVMTDTLWTAVSKMEQFHESRG